MLKVQAYRFPVHLNDTTTAFFKRGSVLNPGPAGAAMGAIAANPADAAAAALLSHDATMNSTLRSTCVTTLIDGGHAENALPQRATANVNCRIVPGETAEATRDALVAAIGNPAVAVTIKESRGPLARPTPLDPKVLGPAEALAKEMFSGLPLVPTMSTGATDSIHFAAVGIPGYGVPGILYDFDLGGMHGLNEHIRVKSVLDGRNYLYRLIRIYAEAK